MSLSTTVDSVRAMSLIFAPMRRGVVPGLVIALGLMCGPAVLQTVRPAAADSPIPSAAAVIGKKDCRGADSKVARDKAKAALRQSRYQQAGQCYLIAGDNAKADFSFVRAAGAEGAVTKRQLAANAHQVKQQFRQLREAFASR